MPNRIIRDSIRTSNSLALLTAEEERHFYRLLVHADDYGRFDARPEVILGACYSLMLNSVSSADVSNWTQRLSIDGIEILTIYTVDGKDYGAFLNWDKYQRIRNSKSKYPEPPSIDSNPPQVAAFAPVVETVTVVENENENEVEDASLRDVPEKTKRRQKRVVELTEEIRAKIVKDYSDRFSALELDFQIKRAMSHESHKKWDDMNLHVRGWLNRELERIGARNGRPGNDPSENNREGAIARAAREQAERAGRSGES